MTLAVLSTPIRYVHLAWPLRSLALAAIYLVWPSDLVNDGLPIVGLVDDAALALGPATTCGAGSTTSRWATSSGTTRRAPAATPDGASRTGWGPQWA